MQRCRPSTRNIVRRCFWHLSLVLSVDLSDTTQQNWVYLIQLRQHQLRKQLDAVGSTRQSGLVSLTLHIKLPGQGKVKVIVEQDFALGFYGTSRFILSSVLSL